MIGNRISDNILEKKKMILQIIACRNKYFNRNYHKKVIKINLKAFWTFYNKKCTLLLINRIDLMTIYMTTNHFMFGYLKCLMVQHIIQLDENNLYFNGCPSKKREIQILCLSSF